MFIASARILVASVDASTLHRVARARAVILSLPTATTGTRPSPPPSHPQRDTRGFPPGLAAATGSALLPPEHCGQTQVSVCHCRAGSKVFLVLWDLAARTLLPRALPSPGASPPSFSPLPDPFPLPPVPTPPAFPLTCCVDLSLPPRPRVLLCPLGHGIEAERGGACREQAAASMA